MKKILSSLLSIVLCTGIASAQDWDFGNSYENKLHNVGIELGLGSGFGEDFTVDFGLRWQYNLHENFAWDVITIKAIADVKKHCFKESITPTVLSGFRVISPNFIGLTAYANARVGYAYNVDNEDGGFAYEVGVGVNVTKHVYIGYAFNDNKVDYYDMDYHAFRLGFLF